MKTILSLLTTAALGLTLAACSAETDQPRNTATSGAGTTDAATVQTAGITVTDPWCRPTPNSAKVAGCYVTLTSGADDVLTRVSTDLASMPQIHEMKHEDGMMKMAELKNGLPLHAGQAVELKPGANHLMLMGLNTPLVEGQTASLTLHFAKAEPITVEVAIRTPPVVDSHE